MNLTACLTARRVRQGRVAPKAKAVPLGFPLVSDETLPKLQNCSALKLSFFGHH
jgi:hypothetical protein